MEEYLAGWDTYKKGAILTTFFGQGAGVGDYVKYFMYLLQFCMKVKYRVYYLTGRPEEKYLKLVDDRMYITQEEMNKQLANNMVVVKSPLNFYDTFCWSDIVVNASDVFKFTDEVIQNKETILDHEGDYICMHVRLGDKFLETPKENVIVVNDTRKFDDNLIHDFINNNQDKTIVMMSDNKAFREKIKNTHDNVKITTGKIGHTGLANMLLSTETLDAITELYILTKSEKVVVCTDSGFPIIPKLFDNTQLEFLQKEAYPKNYFVPKNKL
jgi:hypothetical protein